MQTILILELSIVFIPTAFLLEVMFRWQLKAFMGLYANVRILVQLLLVDYFLTYVFETNQPNDSGLHMDCSQVVREERH